MSNPVIGGCSKHPGQNFVNCPLCEIDRQTMLLKEKSVVDTLHKKLGTEQEGPREYQPFAPKRNVCNGCKYLETTPMMRGHKSVTNNFGCLHPDICKDMRGINGIFGMKGKVIHFNIEGMCYTPPWCPFLKPKQDETTG